MFFIVAAIDQNMGIGKEGKLPWPKLKGDMKFYRELTTSRDIIAVEKRYGLLNNSLERRFESYDNLIFYLKTCGKIPSVDLHRLNAVIMGRKTWESLPIRFKPLPNRINVVLSRSTSLELPDNVLTARNLDGALQMLEQNDVPHTFVIGGGEVFKEAMRHSDCQRIYLTEIFATWECNSFFPDWSGEFEHRFSGFTIRESTLQYCFKTLEKITKAKNAN